MQKFALHWIDKSAEQGPLFRIGEKDVYHRARPGQRIIRLKAEYSPNMTYVRPAVEACRTMAEHWQSPIIFVVEPNLKRPPAARFLLAWSKAVYLNRSVDHSFMVLHDFLPPMMTEVVGRMFGQAGLPFEALSGNDALNQRLDQMNTSIGWPGYSVIPPSLV